jgi:hypothetical protein
MTARTKRFTIGSIVAGLTFILTVVSGIYAAGQKIEQKADKTWVEDHHYVTRAELGDQLESIDKNTRELRNWVMGAAPKK